METGNVPKIRPAYHDSLTVSFLNPLTHSSHMYHRSITSPTWSRYFHNWFIPLAILRRRLLNPKTRPLSHSYTLRFDLIVQAHLTLRPRPKKVIDTLLRHTKRISGVREFVDKRIPQVCTRLFRYKVFPILRRLWIDDTLLGRGSRMADNETERVKCPYLDHSIAIFENSISFKQRAKDFSHPRRNPHEPSFIRK